MTMVDIGQILQDVVNSPLDLGIIQAQLDVWHGNAADWLLLAQQFDTDPSAGIREWFSNLIATGQLWALIIGFIVGYLFRGFTSYG